jgi:hypothetical protein
MVMDFSFNAQTFRDLFHNAVSDYLENEALETDGSANDNVNVAQNLITAMDQAVDVMARADSDVASNGNISTADMSVLEQKDISEIGHYALDLLEGIVSYIEDKSGEQSRELLRLSLPISLWVARHGGNLLHIDMVVNSLAGYANETMEPHRLAELSAVIREVIDACSDEIRKDIDQSNNMRPWRILNLNYGIAATRSHDPKIIEEAYETLVKNLPQDAREFFREGMQQMNIIDYPDEVREIVERYYKMWGSESALH